MCDDKSWESWHPPGRGTIEERLLLLEKLAHPPTKIPVDDLVRKVKTLEEEWEKTETSVYDLIDSNYDELMMRINTGMQRIDDLVRQMRNVEERIADLTGSVEFPQTAAEAEATWGHSMSYAKGRLEGNEQGGKAIVDLWKKMKEESRSCGLCGGVNAFRAVQAFDKALGLDAEDVIDDGGKDE